MEPHPVPPLVRSPITTSKYGDDSCDYGRLRGRNVTRVQAEPILARSPHTSQLGYIDSVAPAAAGRSILSEIDTDPSGWMNCIRCKELPYEILVSRQPTSRHTFWDIISKHQVRIGIQLVSASYHLPFNEPWRQSGFLIRLVSEELLGRVRHWVYRIQNEDSGVESIYEHFHLQWENFGIPDKGDFQRLLDRCSKTMADERNSNRLYIHCVGGHGRSGTLVLTMALMHKPEDTDPTKVLLDLRQQRGRLVENVKQMDFAVSCASEFSDRRFLPWRIGQYPAVGYDSSYPTRRSPTLGDRKLVIADTGVDTGADKSHDRGLAVGSTGIGKSSVPRALVAGHTETIEEDGNLITRVDEDVREREATLTLCQRILRYLCC